MLITKELLEESVAEHESFIEMVCENKYGHKKVSDVIEGVLNYCNITDDKQKELLRSGRFIPAGSILSACNTDRKGSFSNCYFTPIKSDTIESIFDCQKELARTFSMRGGSGVDITVLRPSQEPVDNAAQKSSGAVSFMPSFSELTKTIAQEGRRGALIITLDVRHPDTLKFIWSKAKPQDVFQKDIFTSTYPTIDAANISLKLTDEFMYAVNNDENWTFIFPDIQADKDFYDTNWDGDYDKWVSIGGKLKEYQTVKAKGILNQISEASYICGDPGILFIDTVQENTFGTYIDKKLKPIGCNPCGEQALAAYNNCLLGCFVLPKYINSVGFNWHDFEEDVKIATRLMNLFSNINGDKHPLKSQRDADKFGKRIGIEFTGLGDVFAYLGYKYGDEQSIGFADTLSHNLLYSSIEESINISKEYGSCESLNTKEKRQNFISINPFQRDLISVFNDDILEYGLANTAFLTVGPCGSISILSDNCTSGIEPIFRFSYKRKNRIDGKEYEFIHYPACKEMLKRFNEFNGLSLKEAKKKLNYIEADEIDWKDRINVQSVLQRNIDASISSTINLPKDTSSDIIYNIYLYAWEKGLKGITVFRDGCKEGILSDNNSIKNSEVKGLDNNIDCFPEPYEKELLDIETAVRHRVNWKKSKLYVNVSLDDDETPIEIFAKLPKEAGINGDGAFNPTVWQERSSNWDLSCRLISMLMRYNIPLKDIIDQLDKSTYSLVDAAGILKRILSKYIKNDITDEDDSELDNDIFSECPECKENTYVSEGGCYICKSCGYSKCG